jgi:hypothetical protein
MHDKCVLFLFVKEKKPTGYNLKEKGSAPPAHRVLLCTASVLTGHLGCVSPFTLVFQFPEAAMFLYVLTFSNG